VTERLHLLTTGDPGALTGGHLYQRRMAEAAPDHGFQIQVVSLRGSRPLLAARAALREAAEAGAGAVLLDSIVAAWCAPWLQLGKARLPVIGIVHQPPAGLDASPAARLVLGRLDLAAYRRTARLLVTGEPVAELLHDVGMPAAKVCVVPPGRERRQPGPAEPELRRGRRAGLLCVANWHRRKGVAAILEALAHLPPGHATLHLVGNREVDRASSREIEGWLRTPQLADRVVVHGTLSPERVARMYAGADLFVLPSTGEPYGMVYVEALGAGLPLVGWRSGNLPRLIESGVEGLLVRPGDVGALAAALQVLIEDDALRHSMARRARRRAEALPTWEQSASDFFAAIREALVQARGAADTRPESLKSSE
jgi:glycosyltransferase involved in cell wall biosynthesis